MACTLLAACASLASPHALSQQAAPEPTPQQRVGYLKQWLQQSQQQLRSYAWVETTTVRKGGEVKAQVQKKCFYAPDGTLQKVPMSQDADGSSGSPGALPSGGIRGRIAEHKKQEAKDYLQDVVQLLHSYLPPNAALIQQSVDSGKFAMEVIHAGSDVRLNFHDYLKSGDTLGVDVNPTTNQLLALHVSSYLDSASDSVQLDAQMSVLPDGTVYMSTATLVAASKGITVTIQNSDYVKGGG